MAGLCWLARRLRIRGIMCLMDSERSRVITGRVFRAGQTPPPDTEWADATPEERIDAVWMLTVLCMAWNQEDFIEPRLQRSVVRIQRAEG